MRAIASLIFPLYFVIPVHAQQVQLPMGSHVMIDGSYDSEWSDAAVVVIQDSVRLYFKQTSEFVYIGIQPPAKGYNGGWVDLYLADGGNQLHNLHASQKLGERKLIDGEWPDWNLWWTNQLRWVANYSKPIDVEAHGKKSTGYRNDDMWEYQIRKDAFDGNSWKILVDFSVVLYTFKRIQYPGESTTNSERWLLIAFD